MNQLRALTAGAATWVVLNGSAFVEATRLSTRLLPDELDAAILLPAFGCGVIGNRLCVAVTL
jgi:hypothetical protein